MRLGCSGCLGSVLLLGIATAALATGIWMGARLVEPPAIAAHRGGAAEGVAAQRKLASLGRPERRSGDSLTLSEAELNAFLSRHLRPSRDVPLREVTVRLVGEGVVEIAGVAPAGEFFTEVPLRWAGEWLPAAILEHPTWVSVRAGVRIETPGAGPRRYLRLDVHGFSIGRQPVPGPLVRLFLSPTMLGLLRWRLPETVEAVAVEPGRVRIRSGG